MTNLVYYVIEPDGAGRLLRQIVPSLHSLRQHDRNIAVHLFYAGDPPAGFLHEAARYNVTIHAIPHLSETLARYTPYWRELSGYPTYGKHLCLERLPQADRVLYVDCDTFWFASPERLFETYQGCDFYGCCEVASRLFDPTCYDGTFIDEDALGRICASEGLAFVPPAYSPSAGHVRPGREGLQVAAAGAADLDLVKFSDRVDHDCLMPRCGGNI